MRLILSFFLCFSFIHAKEVSTDEMISQLLMVGFGGTKSSDKWVAQIENDIKKGRIGGVILFRNNIENPTQLQKLTSHLKSIKSKHPVFIAIDQEGGKVQRLTKEKGFTDYPSAFDLARNQTLMDANRVYTAMAKELQANGFNINFGPVVDLNTNPNSPAIGAKQRSYSDKEEIVSAYASEFIDAHKKEGVLTVLKHFPGHGSATADSHLGFTDISKSWDYKELKPYFDFIKRDKVKAVMVGHLSINIFDEHYPASLSKIVINRLLRGKLGFDGVVFSDDMQMKAISDNYTLKESIVSALNAGVDVLVYSSYFLEGSNTPKKVTETIKSALSEGKIKKETIKKAYERVIKLKREL